MKKECTLYEKIEQHLFLSRPEAELMLTPREMEIKRRVMLCVSRRLDNPMESDTDLVQFLTGGCEGVCTPVSTAQAYRDVAAITKMVGNVRLAAKSWYRYLIIEGAKKGYAIALEKRDAKGMAANLDKIGKYTRADKEDDAFDYSMMIPPSFEPTDDITVIGNMTPIENLEAERADFRRLFKQEMSAHAQDIQTETDREPATR